MFIVYSKKTGRIKIIDTSNTNKTIEDAFPRDWEDYQQIYDCINTDNLDEEEVEFIRNNIDNFSIVGGNLVFAEDEAKKKKEKKFKEKYKK